MKQLAKFPRTNITASSIPGTGEASVAKIFLEGGEWFVAIHTRSKNAEYSCDSYDLTATTEEGAVAEVEQEFTPEYYVV